MNGEDIHSLVSAIPLPAFMVFGGVRIVGANVHAEEMLDQEGMVGRHLVTVLRQPSVLGAIDACRKSQKTKTTKYLLTKDRNELTYRVSCGYVRAGTAEGVLVTFEDITHLEAAGQMRRDFVANVSHELKTPLTALIGFIETLQGPAKDDPVAQDRFLSIMSNEAGRMNRLVQDLLSLSHVESEERIRPSQSVDLGTLIDSTLTRLAPLAQRDNVEMAKDIPESAALVPGDEDQLRQIFTNLIENAIKYGGPDQTVSVRLRYKAREMSLRSAAYVVEIQDTGPGIDEVHLPRLTERFYRIDSHRSREMGGTGLGLAIVKHIVNRHRGRLKIDSTLGQGTTFSVILPALD